MQQIPLSASNTAPASITKSVDSSSFMTAAVKPAALEALPDVYIARGLNSATCNLRTTISYKYSTQNK